MPITDKTRKILWGRSGNRCAICKNELVIDATGQDAESVVAEECHIISPRQNGPRSRGHPLKGKSRKKTPLHSKKISLFLLGSKHRTSTARFYRLSAPVISFLSVFCELP